MAKTLEERFWAKVDKTGDCWSWIASKDAYGYGLIHLGGRGSGLAMVHRVSYELAHGSIPAGMCVLHHCDNRACVNPDHLFLGTQQDNVRDMHAKGRHYKQKTRSKLSAGDVLKIRAEYVRGSLVSGVTALARRYGVDRATIALVVTGKTWQKVGMQLFGIANHDLS